MTDQTSALERIDQYIQDLFTPADPALLQNIADANAAGLPPINVSPNEGKLLHLLARLASARRILVPIKSGVTASIRRPSLRTWGSTGRINWPTTAFSLSTPASR